jgi:DNA repair exonuclease SbcCD ATPase subunit
MRVIMVSLKQLLGHDVKLEELPAELRTVLGQLRQERTALDAATARAKESTQQLAQFTQPIANAQRIVAEVQTRVKALERLVPVLATLDEQTEAVSRSQRRTETQLDQMDKDAKELRSEIQQLRGALDGALALKAEVNGLVAMTSGFEALRGDTEAIGGQLRDLGQGLDRARTRQDELHRAGEMSQSRLQSFEERQQHMQGGITAAQTRVAALEQSFAHLDQAAADAAETRHHLVLLKALAEYVTQKVSVVESQREVVDRALAQAGRLDDVLRDIDGKIRRHEEHAQNLTALEGRVAEIQAVHGDLLARSRDISAGHEEIGRADQELRGRLNTLRDDVQRAVKHFELEQEGFTAVEQRIIGLRSALSDMEARFKVVEESSRALGDMHSRADRLATQLGGMAERVADIEPQVARVDAVKSEAQRLADTVDAMAQRVGRLEKTQPAIDQALHDFADLKGRHEAVKDAAERMVVTQQEIARVREAQAETRNWLDAVTESVDGLRGELASVEAMKPTVESVRSEADRVSNSLEQIEARRQLVDQLAGQLADLSTSGSQLEERSRSLGIRMDATDQRFLALNAHAEEAERIEKLVPAVVAAVDRADRRMSDLDESVGTLEKRALNLDGLAEQTRALGQELDLRQASLASATEHLERASELRAEAASIAQQLEDRAGQLTGALATAAERTASLTETLDDLEGRAGHLRFVQKRMAQFEEQFAKWHGTEAQLSRALEQAAQRQASVDALQADLYRLFEVAERTVEHVRAIAGAKDQVTQTRAMLENVLELVGNARDAANGLDQRKRQIEQAEDRLARVEALLADTESSLQSLHGQKAFLDQVIEKAGTLEFYAKQAESLIALLRESTPRLEPALAKRA